MRTALPEPMSTVASAPGHAAATIATGTGPEIPWFRLLSALAFCLLLAWGAIALMRYRQGHGAARPLEGLLGRVRGTVPRRIRIVETRRASQHGDLCLVECDGQLFFLAFTANGATVLDCQDARAEESP